MSFEDYYSDYFKAENSLEESMAYTFLARSKRLRPRLLMALASDLDIPEEKCYPIALAIEMVHNYSLIHDDLPAFDDDDLRRGQLANHKVYGEATAILAGDGLLTDAFDVVCQSDLSDEQKVQIIQLFSQAAGSKGMVLGQFLDKSYEFDHHVTLEQLYQMDALKTGCLFALPLQCGLIMADRQDQLEVFGQIGSKLGVAFQIQDDLMEAQGGEKKLYKSASDVKNGKTTYVSFLGEEKASDTLKKLFAEVEVVLKTDYPKTWQLIEAIENRTW